MTTPTLREAAMAALPESVRFKLAAIAAECSDPGTTDALDELLESTALTSQEQSPADAPAAPTSGEPPNTAAQVRDFIGSQFCALKYGREDHEPCGEDCYTLTAHDLISAFWVWTTFDPAAPGATPPSAAQAEGAVVFSHVAAIEAAIDKILDCVNRPREPNWSYRNTITNNRELIRSECASIRAALTAPSGLPVAHLRSITHPDWLEVCSADQAGAFPVYAAPSVPAEPSLREQLQQKCSDWGAYWRAPDAHGVCLSLDRALELLRDALGVEVEFTHGPYATADECIAALHAPVATPAQADSAGQVAYHAWCGSIDDEATLRRAASVMEDVLTDIEGWEDRALTEAVAESRAAIVALADSIALTAAPEKLAPAPQQAGQAAAWMEMPVPARGDVVVFAIDTARINHLMLDGMMDCLAAAKRARWTNVVTRKDGVERTWEADWLKHLTRLSPDALRALATTAAATPPSPQQTPDPEHAWGSCQTAAIKTLTALGYTWDGSAQWTAPQQAAQGGEREAPLDWEMLTRFGRVDRLKFYKSRGEWATEKVECVILTREDVARLARAAQGERAGVGLTAGRIDAVTMSDRDALIDHVSEYGTTAEGQQRYVRRIARAIERACAEAWGVKLVTTEGGGE